MTKVRTLKVTEQTRINGKNYQRRTLTRSPKIQLSGNWLQKAGFAIGDVVELMIADNFIQILKLDGGKEAANERG